MNIVIIEIYNNIFVLNNNKKIILIKINFYCHYHYHCHKIERQFGQLFFFHFSKQFL